MPSDATFPGKGFFERVYQGAAPWDIGAPQPALIELVEEFPPKGPVLDLGCGTGDLVIALAERGIDAIGAEFVPSAIEVARARVGALPPEVQARIQLEVGDALKPSAWRGRIGSIIDSGFMHLFDDETRKSLAGELASALPAGGRFYLLGFAITFPVPDVPREVSAVQVEALFPESAGWKMLALRPALFQTKGFDPVPATAACVERVG